MLEFVRNRTGEVLPDKASSLLREQSAIDRLARIGRYSLYLFLLLLVVGVISFATLRPILVLPRIRLAPGFAMRNLATTEPLYSDSLRGQFTLYSFTYAECLEDGDACETSFDEFEQLANDYFSTADTDIPLKFVTILLDEALDPAWLDARPLDHLPDDWVFLHGDPLETRYVVGQGFNLFYAPAGSAGYHTNYVPSTFVLVDGLGIIRSEYRAGRPDLSLLARDIDLLQVEYQNREGVGRIGYEAAHLFVCYP